MEISSLDLFEILNKSCFELQFVDDPNRLQPLGHSLKTVVTPLSGGKTPNLVRREIGNMQV